MLHALKERKRTMRSERKRTQCPTLHNVWSLNYVWSVVLHATFHPTMPRAQTMCGVWYYLPHSTMPRAETMCGVWYVLPATFD